MVKLGDLFLLGGAFLILNRYRSRARTGGVSGPSPRNEAVKLFFGPDTTGGFGEGEQAPVPEQLKVPVEKQASVSKPQRPVEGMGSSGRDLGTAQKFLKAGFSADVAATAGLIAEQSLMTPRPDLVQRAVKAAGGRTNLPITRGEFKLQPSFLRRR